MLDVRIVSTKSAVDESAPHLAHQLLTPRLIHTNQHCKKRGRAVAPALPAQSARPLGQGVLDLSLLTLATPQGHAKRPLKGLNRQQP